MSERHTVSTSTEVRLGRTVYTAHDAPMEMVTFSFRDASAEHRVRTVTVPAERFVRRPLGVAYQATTGAEWRGVLAVDIENEVIEWTR